MSWLARFFGSRKKPDLICGVMIEPSGTSRVEFQPVDAAPEVLLRLVFCYLAKVRWLLESEPTALLEGLKVLLEDVRSDFMNEVEENFLDSLPSVAQLRADQEGDWAAPGGETFVIRLYLGDVPHVRNDLPRGLAFNLPWHVLLLIEAVREKLNPSEREVFVSTLNGTWDALFVEPVGNSFRALRQLNESANEALDTGLVS